MRNFFIVVLLAAAVILDACQKASPAAPDPVELVTSVTLDKISFAQPDGAVVPPNQTVDFEYSMTLTVAPPSEIKWGVYLYECFSLTTEITTDCYSTGGYGFGGGIGKFKIDGSSSVKAPPGTYHNLIQVVVAEDTIQHGGLPPIPPGRPLPPRTLQVFVTPRNVTFQ